MVYFFFDKFSLRLSTYVMLELDIITSCVEALRKKGSMLKTLLRKIEIKVKLFS